MTLRLLQHKGSAMKEMICYCFNYTRADIEKDIVKNGHSMIMKKIIREKQFGNCQCSSLNLKGK